MSKGGLRLERAGATERPDEGKRVRVILPASRPTAPRRRRLGGQTCSLRPAAPARAQAVGVGGGACASVFGRGQRRADRLQDGMCQSLRSRGVRMGGRQRRGGLYGPTPYDRSAPRSPARPAQPAGHTGRPAPRPNRPPPKERKLNTPAPHPLVALRSSWGPAVCGCQLPPQRSPAQRLACLRSSHLAVRDHQHGLALKLFAYGLQAGRRR